jgi:DNA polymerase-3 subunit beta
MKFTIEKKAFLDSLQVVQNVVSSRSTLPILSNVLVKAENDKITFTTTDLEVTVTCGATASIDQEGSSTLPVRRLASIIRELPDGDVELELADDDVATLTSGSSFFRIIGISAEEFPNIPDVPSQYSYTLDQGIFREMLKKTSYAASTDETRYVLNGVLLNFGEDRLTMVATDGRRLALVENELELASGSEADIILPSKAVNELLHVLDDEGELKISITDNQVIFEFNDILVATKLIDGVYPNYRQVIPASCDERVSIDRELLINALRRVGLIATDKSAPMKFTFADNELVLSVNTPDVGEARESIAIKYDGKPIPIAFNPDFLMDPLKNLSNDDVYFELTDELSPGVLKADIPFLYVLMPMRLD